MLTVIIAKKFFHFLDFYNLGTFCRQDEFGSAIEPRTTSIESTCGSSSRQTKKGVRNSCRTDRKDLLLLPANVL